MTIMSASASHFSGWLQKQGGVSSGKAGVSAQRVFFVPGELLHNATHLPTMSPISAFLFFRIGVNDIFLLMVQLFDGTKQAGFHPPCRVGARLRAR